MANVSALVLRAPGTNCDAETAYAFELAGASAEILHINRVLESPSELERFQVLCIPGGFSYGDDVAAGRILANQFALRLGDALQQFREIGKLILGICNGFQVLIKSGLLTDPGNSGRRYTRLNDHGRYEDRWVHLQVDGDRCVFLPPGGRLYLPLAHAEGKFTASDESILNDLESQGRLSLRYSQESGGVESETLPFPVNPNGSQRNVAGMCDATGRVFGMMPHPERYIDPTQRPDWTRLKDRPERGDGHQIFAAAVRALS